jgi:hypothetical protein
LHRAKFMVTKSISLFGRELFRVERNRAGEFSYSFIDGGTDFINSTKYLDMSLNNPVLMTICAIRSSLYSQMKIAHVDSKGNEIQNSPYLKLLKNPNYFQSQNDWLYQQMWFLSTAGTNFIYQKKAFSNSIPSAIYNLIPSEIDLNKAHRVNKFIVTKKDIISFGEREIKYTLDDTEYKLKLNELIPLYDLSNGLVTNSFFTSESRVKGICKVLQNIDENLYSKRKNLQMSQKYLGVNQSTGNEAIIQPKDRSDIETKIGEKSLILTNRPIEVNHLVSNMKNLYLDEQFSDDANKCLLAFEMNKNVLNYFAKDSTFENQQQGIISYIQNSIQSTADSTMDSLSQQWGLFEQNQRLVASFDHLPVMQQIINDKISSFTELQNAIKISLENGTMTNAEAIKMSNDFKSKLKL